MEYIYTDKDGNQTKFTDDMVRAAIDERNELRLQLAQTEGARDAAWHNIIDVRSKVFDFFNSSYSTGEEDIGPISVTEVNELLESIGADTLKRLWSIVVRVEVTVTDVEAASEDEASEAVENNLEITYDGNSVDFYEVDVVSVEQQ